MRRITAGEYRTLDGRYRVVHGWGDSPGWTILQLAENGDAEVLDTLPRLRDARDQLEPKAAS